MTSNYSPVLPVDYKDDHGIKEFIAEFFRISDDPEKNEAWVDFYHDNGTFVLNNTTSQGREDIRKARSAMWDQVAERKHEVEKAVPARFPCPKGEDCLDLTLFGKVHQTLKSGDTRSVDWVSHGRLKRQEGSNDRWQFAYYRVYLV